ncbi:MAG: hypothetical protein AB7I27_07645 [Bacteriovoracaceae bacterium]
MKSLIFLLILCFSRFGYSSSEYANVQLIKASETFNLQVNNIFTSLGFYSIRGFSNIEVIGINQIFFDSNGPGYVTVKYDVQGDFELNTFLEVPTGKVFHLMVGDKVIALYFHKIPSSKSEKVIKDIQNHHFKKYSKAILDSFIVIAPAHANNDCALGAEVLNQEPTKTISDVSSFSVASGLMSCLKGIGSHFTESYDQAVDFKKSIGNFVENPSKKIQDYYQNVTGAINGFGHMIYSFAEAIVNPAEGLAKLRTLFGEAGTYLTDIFSVITSFPPEAAIKMACSFITGIGVNTLLTALTAGAGAALLVLKLKSIQSTLKHLKKLAEIMKSINLTDLSKLGLSSETLDKLFSKISLGKFDANKLKVFIDSLTFDSELAKKFAKRGLECSLQ